MKKETKYWELRLEMYGEEVFEAKDIIAAAKYAKKSADACFKGKESDEIMHIKQLTFEEYEDKVRKKKIADLENQKNLLYMQAVVDEVNRSGGVTLKYGEKKQ